MMTLQEAFDIISVHLLRQGRRSTSADGLSCLYRSDDGCMCAIGVLIPDKMYSPKIECRSIKCILLDYPNLPFAHLPIEFLKRSQRIHDRYEPEDWEKELRLQAFNCNLNTDTMDKFLKSL